MTIANHIRDLLKAKADALVRRASGELAALIHPHFLYVNAGGRAFGKTEYIDAYSASGAVVFLEQRLSGLQVRAFGGSAVATMLLDDKFRVGGREEAGRYRSLCAFVLSEERWLWAAGKTATRE